MLELIKCRDCHNHKSSLADLSRVERVERNKRYLCNIGLLYCVVLTQGLVASQCKQNHTPRQKGDASVKVLYQSFMLSLFGGSVVQGEKTRSISWLFGPKWLQGLWRQAPAELLSAVAAGGKDSVAHFEKAAAAGSADLLAVRTGSTRADRVTGSRHVPGWAGRVMVTRLTV